MERGGYVYILTNFNHNVLYTGVTSSLKERIFEHKSNKYPTSFSAKYRTHKLVYYHGFKSIEEAIINEKKVKGWTRNKKIDLINSFNPKWDDLYETVSEFD